MTNTAHAFDHLTPRELEILFLIAEGLSAKQTAVRLLISPRTVERHVDNIRLKLRARNRSHMIWLAYANGVATAGAAIAPGTLRADLAPSSEPLTSN